MPTSVTVNDLKINELTEAQYDAAVQGGVIGEHELSVITDMTDKAVQVSALPTASATELGNIYQYVGATDANYTNGYFYKCVSDGQEPATYSWTRIDVQPTPEALPDQTGQNGKFLTTNGTDASWSNKPLVNGAAGTDSLAVLGDSYNTANSVVVGKRATTGIADGSYSVLVGWRTSASQNQGIAIGARASVGAIGAIQLGSQNPSSSATTNSDANTFKVANANGNFEIMSADGTVPTARLTKVNTTATLAVADWSSSTQTITVSGVKADSVVFVSPAPASASDYASAGILCTAQAADSLTFTCGTTPTNAITVNIVCL